MAKISLVRAAEIDYTIIRGDSFYPSPVAFTIDDVAEDFSGCTLRMQVRKDGTEISEITSGAGITVTGNSLQYSIPASEMASYEVGTYKYDVEKTDGTGLVETIQTGKIKVIADQTY